MDEFGRSLRVREVRNYQEDNTKVDDVIEGKRQFSVEEKLTDEKFNENLKDVILELQGKDFDLKYIQENGFQSPVLFKSPEGLGIKMPDSNQFTVNDVKSYVGARRVVDIFDCDTHEGGQMTIHQWVKYYQSEQREKILNVTSLECSHTGIDRIVKCPDVVESDLDWVRFAWPEHLLAEQKDTTNSVENMKYPKIRKYCLMSVGGCYTDFHIDFGGTSVWYHILKGAKVFWLIAPTEKNLRMYEEWTLSERQGEVFFGDFVDQCHRVHLVPGDTFMIPTGWIHSVYTPEDSIVFGGNYIHSYNIPLQLRCAKIEEATHTPNKLRFPFFAQLHWYVMKKYVDILERDLDERRMLEFENTRKSKWVVVNLTKEELEGLRELCETFREWTFARSNYPQDMKENKNELLDRLEELLDYHSEDDQFLACRGINIFKQYEIDKNSTDERNPLSPLNTPNEMNVFSSIVQQVKKMETRSKTQPEKKEESHEDTKKDVTKKNKDDEDNKEKNGSTSSPKRSKRVKEEKPNISYKQKDTPDRSAKKVSGKPKAIVRRVRCRTCESCTRENCNECRFCLDMPRNGGPGLMRQCCSLRFCKNPKLPSYVECYVCKNGYKDDNRLLMECSVCAEIVHPSCLKKSHPCKISKKVNNCWECPKCCTDKKAGKFSEDKASNIMPEQKKKWSLKAEQECDEGSPGKKAPPKNQMAKKVQNLKDILQKAREQKNKFQLPNNLKRVKDEKEDSDSSDDEPLIKKKIVKTAVNNKTEEERSPISPMCSPTLVVRPSPIALLEHCQINGGEFNHILPRELWIRVFTHLEKSDLTTCMYVCRAWNQWYLDQRLWQEMDVSNREVTSLILCGIVRRQPNKLNLSGTNITCKQLQWLLKRLSYLEALDLSLNNASSIAALLSSDCRHLTSLDLSWCSAVYDRFLAHLLSQSNMTNLQLLKLNGCDIGDETTAFILTNLKRLRHLDISHCSRVTKHGLQSLDNGTHACKESLSKVLSEGLNCSNEDFLAPFRSS